MQKDLERVIRPRQRWRENMEEDQQEHGKLREERWEQMNVDRLYLQHSAIERKSVSGVAKLA